MNTNKVIKIKVDYTGYEVLTIENTDDVGVSFPRTRKFNKCLKKISKLIANTYAFEVEAKDVAIDEIEFNENDTTETIIVRHWRTLNNTNTKEFIVYSTGISAIYIDIDKTKATKKNVFDKLRKLAQKKVDSNLGLENTEFDSDYDSDY